MGLLIYLLLLCLNINTGSLVMFTWSHHYQPCVQTTINPVSTSGAAYDDQRMPVIVSWHQVYSSPCQYCSLFVLSFSGLMISLWDYPTMTHLPSSIIPTQPHMTHVLCVLRKAVFSKLCETVFTNEMYCHHLIMRDHAGPDINRQESGREGGRY